MPALPVESAQATGKRLSSEARDRAEEAARSALQKRAVDERPSRSLLQMTTDKRTARTGSVREASKRATARRRGQDTVDRPADPGTRLRVLAPDALRPVPGREPPADAPGRRGRQPGRVRGAGPAERAPNGFVLAARYASRMLPQIFRVDDVLLEIEFAPEHRLPWRSCWPACPRDVHRPTTAWGGSTSSGRPRRRTRSTRAARRSTGGRCRR